MWNPFRRSPSQAARQLSLIGHRNRREHIRAVCDDMRERMGLPKAEWPKL